jgi:hypothetical protein
MEMSTEIKQIMSVQTQAIWQNGFENTQWKAVLVIRDVTSELTG